MKLLIICMSLLSVTICTCCNVHISNTKGTKNAIDISIIDDIDSSSTMCGVSSRKHNNKTTHILHIYWINVYVYYNNYESAVCDMHNMNTIWKTYSIVEKINTLKQIEGGAL